VSLRCEECGQRFGGQFIYDRHLDRRNDRCRTPEELRLRGMKRDRRRVWHREAPTGQRTLPGILPRGSRTLEDRRMVQGATTGPYVALEGPPQQSRALSEVSR
jgi:hypothetical protein